MSIEILQGTVVLPNRVLDKGQIVVEHGVIQAILEGESARRPTIDFGERYIAPGFIDIHTHGIAGVDTMDGSQDALAVMARRFAAHGVTGFLPTTMTERPDVTVRAVRAVHDFMKTQEVDHPAHARILGVHLEGPWISPQYKGAQNERYIVPPDEGSVRTILEAAAGAVIKVTLAPELPGADDLIRLLRSTGICVSIGHSGATYEQAMHALKLGATHVTHCFNAMAGLHHRQPGIVGAALLEDGLFVELIADDVHVHSAAMRLLVSHKGRERVVLITDSMSATERVNGTYALGGQEVFVRNGEARLPDGTLAGSTLVLDGAVRNLVALCQVPLTDAIYMASASPAAAIGLGSSKGRVSAGYDADLVVLDPNLEPVAVLVGGTLHWIEERDEPIAALPSRPHAPGGV